MKKRQMYNYITTIVFISISMVSFGQNKINDLFSYSYAYGTDVINVYWGYNNPYSEELIGCNLIRYKPFFIEPEVVNEELITSPDSNFYYLDTLPNDTSFYQYGVEFVFPSDTNIKDIMVSSYFENITFKNIGDSQVELTALQKEPNNLYCIELWTGLQVDYFFVEDTFSVVLNPYEIEPYADNIFFQFYDMDSTLPIGCIGTSINHLKHFLLTNVSPNTSPPSLILSSSPNPIRENSIITANITESDIYSISIFNQNGILVRSLDQSYLSVGSYDYSWDRSDDSGGVLPSGLYYCVISSTLIRKTIKLVVL